ncbi:hypothetical protein GCM10011309_00990 [Litorimonas cladophorae]|uniref:Uncharacterized protein n=1 Tax=Litorimonas cladophorae TaxID=1220491 RepID=A0A918NBL4_9PROT|nr:hypothetical protein [Litorimonas cladophorae]GGX56068.1 hypothetical protein GCM10011309_00990 [Litorimonas cladophorae]
MTAHTDQPLRIDRTLTFGLIVTILIQTASGLVWAGAAGARLSALESQIALTPGISERLARVEGQTIHIEQSLMRIERRLGHVE